MFKRIGVVVILAPLVLATCRQKTGGQPRAAATPAVESEGLAADARTAYEDAKRAVSARDYGAAQARLQEAVSAQPDFTEGWYNLGATQVHLAIQAARDGRDGEAVQLFRQAVESKRTARGLMEQKRWYVYLRAAEQDQVRSDVDQGLEDADEVLADEQSLLAALRLWAGQVR